jgi:hypothetical protein
MLNREGAKQLIEYRFVTPSEWLREQNFARDPQFDRHCYEICNRFCFNFKWGALTER